MIAPQNEYSEHKLLRSLQVKRDDKEKGAFYCSDFGKNPMDLYFKLKNEPETEPTEWYNYVRFGAGKGAEIELLKLLKDIGIVGEDYEQDTHGRVDFVREGIEIHGYIDAVSTGERSEEFGIEKDAPIEIKTINNKNFYDIARYQEGNPREGYVGQLAIYMDFLGKDVGYLFVVALDGLSRFLLKCEKQSEGVYKCGNTVVNLTDEYKRWADLYTNNVLKDIVPEWNVRYKIPLEEINWASMDTADIKKALLGTVIGDKDKWQIDYSPYKTKILDIMGATLGYDDLEKMKIRELSGYDIINGRMTKRKI
jgi:hypothetical protein